MTAETADSHRRVHIDALGHLGDGVALTAEGPVHVAGALPGEMAEGRVTAEPRRLWMPAPRIDEPSPHRIGPPCPHVPACGGCRLQHAGDGFLAAWKAGLIAEALAARGLSATIRPMAVSPPGSRRRVTLAARRTRKGVLLGFHGRAAHSIVPIASCPVADPRIVAAFPALAALCGRVAARKGEIRVAVTASEDGLDVDLDGGKAPDAAGRAALAEAAHAAGLARLSLSGETVATIRPPAQRMGNARVVPPPAAFLQATPQGEAALVAGVAEALGGARRVVDLFAGVGTFALPLAGAMTVHAVEAEGAALAALDAGWRGAPGLRTVTTEVRDLFRRPLLPAELDRFDAAVVDPPRAGAEAQSRALAASRLDRLAMVSCNPASFARDARLLADGGWRIDWVQPVDQFRWSAHVELVAALSRGPVQGMCAD